MQILVLFRFMRFSERFRHSFTSFGTNFWICGVRMVRIRGSAGMVLQHSLLGEFRQTVWTMYTKRSILPKIIPGNFFRKFPIYLKINFQNLKNSQFFINFKINFRNCIFQKYFFRMDFFRLFFFAENFLGV